MELVSLSAIKTFKQFHQAPTQDHNISSIKAMHLLSGERVFLAGYCQLIDDNCPQPIMFLKQRQMVPGGEASQNSYFFTSKYKLAIIRIINECICTFLVITINGFLVILRFSNC